MKSYKELIVWQKSIELVVEVYKVTKLFPQSELYGLTAQMRRASVSIPSNIAEGSCRISRNDFLRFVYNAFGSGAELETQIIIVKRLNLVSKEKIEKIEVMLEEVMKMLNSLIKQLKK